MLNRTDIIYMFKGAALTIISCFVLYCMTAYFEMEAHKAEYATATRMLQHAPPPPIAAKRSPVTIDDGRTYTQHGRVQLNSLIANAH